MDIRRGRSISRAARVYLSSDEAAEVIRAGALLVESSLTRTLANFFLRLNRPKTHIFMFTSEAAALAWLREQVY